MPATSTHSTATYRRTARDAARAAIRNWLGNLRRSGMYLFSVNGVEYALEYFRGHWGMEGGGRWRWGRVGSDPDESISGEDVLLEVALGRVLPQQPPSGPRRRPDSPVHDPHAALTRAEVRQRTYDAATAHLNKLVLTHLPPI